MKIIKSRHQIIWVAALSILAAVLFSGVYAANNIVLNSGDTANLGAGAQKVDPCDNDVNVSAITYNDGDTVYLQGFQYDNADKPGCVGYDFETRFVKASGQPAPLFATTSIGSEPELIRVFAPTSSATWQLGLGAVPSLEATVTQISASSFKVIFANPISLATEIGKIVMAEINHLPLGTFTGTAQTFSALQKSWLPISINSTGSYFYVADYDQTIGQGKVYKSGTIGSNFSSTVLTPISSLPGGDGVSLHYWSDIDQSDSGKYVVAVGGGLKSYFSTDFGVSWDSVTASLYSGGANTANTLISMSSDGMTVCMVSDGGSTVNIWKNGTFYTKSTRFAYFSSPYVVRSCKVSPDGSAVYIAQGNDLGSIYRILVSSISAGANSFSGKIGASHNYYRLAVSENGKNIVVGYKVATVPVYVRWLVSNDYGQNFSTPSGLPTTETWYVGDLRVSRSGKNMVVTSYDGGSSGGLWYSTDYGSNFQLSGLGNTYFERVSASADGSLIIAGAQSWTPGNLRLLRSD